MFKLLKLFYLHENTHNFHLPSSIFHTCCFNLLFNWTSTVGLKISLNGNRTNVYEHVVAVHARFWCTLCSVCAMGARVALP